MTAPINPPPLRNRLIVLQSLTLAWMLVECAVSLLSAARAHSPALLAFGFDSFVELLSASLVVLALVPRFNLNPPPIDAPPAPCSSFSPPSSASLPSWLLLASFDPKPVRPALSSPWPPCSSCRCSPGKSASSPGVCGRMAIRLLLPTWRPPPTLSPPTRSSPPPAPISPSSRSPDSASTPSSTSPGPTPPPPSPPSHPRPRGPPCHARRELRLLLTSRQQPAAQRYPSASGRQQSVTPAPAGRQHSVTPSASGRQQSVTPLPHPCNQRCDCTCPRSFSQSR